MSNFCFLVLLLSLIPLFIFVYIDQQHTRAKYRGLDVYIRAINAHGIIVDTHLSQGLIIFDAKLDNGNILEVLSTSVTISDGPEKP